MLYWTFRSLLAEWGRVLAAAAGIALALLLGLYLDAVFRGEGAHIVTFVERTPGDVWVLQKGVENLHMTVTSISENAIAEVRRTEGIAGLTRVVYRPSSIGEPGEERIAYVVGVPEDQDVRRRWAEAAGWPAPAPGDVILPEPMLRAGNFQIGGTVRVGDSTYNVAGVSHGTFSMANPLVFVHERDARRQFDVSDGASLLLIDAARGAEPYALAARIEEESDDVRALPRESLVRNDFDLALQMGGALVGILSLIGMGVATLVVIFTAYAFQASRSPELAVAKALGAKRHHLIYSAMLETGLIALLGGALALAAIGPAEVALTRWMPDVAVDFSLTVALRLAGVMLVVAEAAALIPAVHVLKVDPALVFRG